MHRSRGSDSRNGLAWDQSERFWTRMTRMNTNGREGRVGDTSRELPEAHEQKV
jgi:hypothetical protein